VSGPPPLQTERLLGPPSPPGAFFLVPIKPCPLLYVDPCTPPPHEGEGGVAGRRGGLFLVGLLHKKLH